MYHIISKLKRMGAAGGENELGEGVVLWSIFQFLSSATALPPISKY